MILLTPLLCNQFSGGIVLYRWRHNFAEGGGISLQWVAEVIAASNKLQGRFWIEFSSSIKYIIAPKTRPGWTMPRRLYRRFSANPGAAFGGAASCRDPDALRLARDRPGNCRHGAQPAHSSRENCSQTLRQSEGSEPSAIDEANQPSLYMLRSRVHPNRYPNPSPILIGGLALRPP